MQEKPSTWITIYTTVIEREGVYGYSWYYKHDLGNKSGMGIFKGGIVDKTHAEMCAIGAAVVDIKAELHDWEYKGVTIYTASDYAIRMLQEFSERGYISTSEQNMSYVVNMTTLFKSLRTKFIYPNKNQLPPQTWIIAALLKKIEKYLLK